MLPVKTFVAGAPASQSPPLCDVLILPLVPEVPAEPEVPEAKYTLP